jgi:hypothetical protein
MKDKVKFKDLSASLKTLVVLTWILIGIYAIAFLMGMLIGIAEALV